jgi:hypothetical protein
MQVAVGKRCCSTNLADFMRRILHSVLVLLVVAGLVVPIAASDTAVLTPICCLGKGEHHCLGTMLGSGDTATERFSRTPDKCPYLPLALAAMHGPHLAPPVRAQVNLAALQSAPIALESKDSATSSAVASRPERGPPAFSLN